MSLARFVDRTLAQVLRTPAELARLPTGSIPGSLFSGGAGVAFFLYEAARLRREPRILRAARRWNDASRLWGERASAADWVGFGGGLLIGRSGAAYVDALLADSPDERLRAVLKIEAITYHGLDLRPDLRPTEIVGGAAGVLGGARDLLGRFAENHEDQAAIVVLARVAARMGEVLRAAHESSLDELGADESIGLAHGVAGELWMLAKVVGPDDPVVAARLRELAALKRVDEDGLAYWLPSRRRWGPHQLGTWCHGVAGHALLWCAIAELTKGTSRGAALDLARASIESTSLLAADVANLCCGLTGHAIAMDRFAELTRDPQLSMRAYRRLVRALEMVDDVSPDSSSNLLGLWQGTLGIALVCLKRLAGERDMPLLEPPRRRL